MYSQGCGGSSPFFGTNKTSDSGISHLGWLLSFRRVFVIWISLVGTDNFSDLKRPLEGNNEEPYGVPVFRDKEEARDGPYHGSSGGDCAAQRREGWVVLCFPHAYHGRN